MAIYNIMVTKTSFRTILNSESLVKWDAVMKYNQLVLSSYQ